MSDRLLVVGFVAAVAAFLGLAYWFGVLPHALIGLALGILLTLTHRK